MTNARLYKLHLILKLQSSPKKDSFQQKYVFYIPFVSVLNPFSIFMRQNNKIWSRKIEKILRTCFAKKEESEIYILLCHLISQCWIFLSVAHWNSDDILHAHSQNVFNLIKPSAYETVDWIERQYSFLLYFWHIICQIGTHVYYTHTHTILALTSHPHKSHPPCLVFFFLRELSYCR